MIQNNNDDDDDDDSVDIGKIGNKKKSNKRNAK